MAGHVANPATKFEYPMTIRSRVMKGYMVVLGTALGTLMVPGYWSLQMG